MSELSPCQAAEATARLTSAASVPASSAFGPAPAPAPAADFASTPAAASPLLWGLAAVLLWALPSGATAFERLDHRGQPALSVLPGFEHLILSGKSGEKTISEPGAFAELSFGLPGTMEGGQAILGLRLGQGETEGTRLVAPSIAWRSYAGEEEWKSFFDVGAFGRILPVWGAGLRIGVGMQYELSQHLGVYFATGGSVAFGEMLQVGYDLGLGLQLRFGEPGFGW